MKRNAIIENLFSSKNFNDCIRKMEPEHLREDLKSEVILIICELPEEKLIGLAERKELEFYTVRVILNLIKSATSPFHKTYRQTKAELKEMKDHPFDEINEIVERYEREVIEDALIEEIEDMKNDKHNNARWYSGQMIDLYKKHGNFRAIETETGIPFISCYKNIKKSLEELRQISKRKVSVVDKQGNKTAII